jgi:AraC-like DNA-binding protein
MPHWTLPRAAASAHLMIRLAEEEYGVTPTQCIAGTDLTPDELDDPAREIEGRQELAVLRNILRVLPPEVPFGLLAGLRYHSTTHGMWGFALLASPHGRAAIEVGLRYFDLSYSFNRVSFEMNERQGRLLYEDSDNPDDVRASLVERDIAALITLQQDVLGRTIPFQSLQLRSPRPAYAESFESLLGVVPRFNAAVNCVGIDLAALATPQPMADELGLRVCEARCRELIEQRGARSGLAGRVRNRIISQPGEFPSMQTVAEELGMSTRTLRNRLGREGTSYRELLEQVREALAEQLLASEMTIDAIAQRLGYTDTSSFTAAFKRWKGVPPRDYKEGS